MNTKARIILTIAMALLAGATLWATLAWAAPGHTPLAPGGSPTVVAYQGEVQVSGTPYSGDGYFKFAVVNADGSTTYWSNDGTGTGGSEPTAAVQQTVSEGLFSVLLGDTSLTGMSQPLTAGVFSQPDRYLRVWFSDDNITFDQLTPDTHIAAVPYALQAQEAADAGTVDGYEGAALEESAEIDADVAAHAAASDAHHARYTDGEAWAAALANDGSGSGLDADTVDGLHASQLGTHYQNVVVVAKSGGDYTSVQTAIDSITDAAAGNPYLVWVAPGVYSETVTMKPYVHLQGAGQEATVISSTAGSSTWPPQATLVLASDTSLRDLTVGNGGTGTSNAALLATAGMTHTLVADVTARAQGSGTNNYAIVLNGGGTGVTLRQVTALAENGSILNEGLLNEAGAAAALRGGSYTGRGGTDAYGIYNADSDTMLEAENVTALGENGSGSNYGLLNDNSAAATLYDSSFTARGGTDALGIYNDGSDTTLETANAIALGENGSNGNSGLFNDDRAAAVLRGGSFTGRGGETDAYGIGNAGSDTTLEAEGITALGENCTTHNFGLNSFSGAKTALRGGSFIGRGGQHASGIGNHYSDTTLEATGVTALGENGSSNNHGLLNFGAEAMLRGGSFTGRGELEAIGIHNDDGSLEAESVTALAENGSNFNHGLYSFNGAEATLRGGSFTGRGGTEAFGIFNSGITTTLEADSVTALGEDGSFVSAGLANETDAAATLRGGAFTGRAGTYAFGVINYISTTMEAEGITALGENGSTNSCGMVNTNGATATLRGGSFTGRGGVNATGIDSSGSVATLEAESVTALGENGSNNRGLRVTGTGDVTHSVLAGTTDSVKHSGALTTTISHSRLVGGAASGNVTCVLVTRGTTISTDGSTCP